MKPFVIMDGPEPIKLDHLLPDYGCKWSPLGVLQRMPTFTYTKPMYYDHPEWGTWELGRVKLRTDGRWSWWRFPSPHPSIEWRLGEGVALTQMDALFDVQRGWLPAHSQIQRKMTPMAEVYEYSLLHTTGGDAIWNMRVVLGRVIDTHTGVWTWARHKSKYFPEWKKGKGTCRSRRLACQNLMDGWR